MFGFGFTELLLIFILVLLVLLIPTLLLVFLFRKTRMKKWLMRTSEARYFKDVQDQTKKK